MSDTDPTKNQGELRREESTVHVSYKTPTVLFLVKSD
jgi:hypothetical protein